MPTENWAARLGSDLCAEPARLSVEGAPGAKMSLLGLLGPEVDILSEDGVRLRGRRHRLVLLKRQSMCSDQA